MLRWLWTHWFNTWALTDKQQKYVEEHWTRFVYEHHKRAWWQMIWQQLICYLQILKQDSRALGVCMIVQVARPLIRVLCPRKICEIKAYARHGSLGRRLTQKRSDENVRTDVDTQVRSYIKAMSIPPPHSPSNEVKWIQKVKDDIFENHTKRATATAWVSNAQLLQLS